MDMFNFKITCLNVKRAEYLCEDIEDLGGFILTTKANKKKTEVYFDVMFKLEGQLEFMKVWGADRDVKIELIKNDPDEEEVY